MKILRTETVLEIHRHRLENNAGMEVKEIGCKILDLSCLG
jgi:hypothetical protein